MILLTLTGQHKKSRLSAILVSPLDFHGYVIDLPPLKSDQQEGAVRYLLRTMHPGDPSETCIDFRNFCLSENTRSLPQNRVVAFAADKKVLDVYRAHKAPLIPGIALLSCASETAGKNIKLGILATPEWIEVALFKDTILLTTAALDPEKDPAWLSHLSRLTDFPEPADLTVFILAVDCEKDKLKALTDKLSAISEKPPIAVSLEKITASLSPSRDEIFKVSNTRFPSRGKRALAVLIALNLLIGATSLIRLADRAERNSDNAKKIYDARKKEANEIEKVTAEIRKLESERSLQAEGQPTTPYAVISDLTSNLHGAWVRSLVIRDNAFQLEAEGADALAVLSSLSTAKGFTGVTLHQATPSPIRGELFSISGYLVYDKK